MDEWWLDLLHSEFCFWDHFPWGSSWFFGWNYIQDSASKKLIKTRRINEVKSDFGGVLIWMFGRIWFTNISNKSIKLKFQWNHTIIEVENGGIQKVTTIGGIHFSLLWLWEEGYHRTNPKQTTWKRFWKLKPGPHEVSTIPIWFPAFRQSSEAIGSNIWPSLATCKKVFPQSCASLPSGCW